MTLCIISVANMPGAVPRTSAYALNNAVLPYGLEITNKGWVRALKENRHLMNGLTVCKGKITHSKVARDLNLDYTKTEESLAA